MAFFNDIPNCIATLNTGGVILYPTDTIWGLGCDAENADAVEKIFQLKNRPPEKSMIVLMRDKWMLDEYMEEVPEALEEQIGKQDRPTTFVVAGVRNVAANLLAQDGTLGMRVPNDAFCQALLRKFGKPIVSTSANLSGEYFEGSFSQINLEIVRKADYVVSWRQEEQISAQPSRVVKMDPFGKLLVLRD